MTDVHLHNLTLPALCELVRAHGQPEYRFRQLAAWLYPRLAVDFDQMTDLPKTFRAELASACRISTAAPAAVQESKLDGTRKYLFTLSDGKSVESVLMRYGDRTTLCVSSQVGCPLDCAFCETARGGFARNLSTGEILDQICALKRDAELESKKVHVVFMGMGEPMLNLEAVVAAIGVLNHPLGFDMGARRITVSTSSFPDRIRSLADADIDCSLALSLNAADDATRARIMPKASRFAIGDLLDAARYFVSSGRRRVTIEYVLLRGVNTSDADARRLGRLVHGQPFKVNLIPYNPARDPTIDPFQPMTEDAIERFAGILTRLAPAVTVRRSRGVDIDAACGQLWTSTMGRKNKPVEGTA